MKPLGSTARLQALVSGVQQIAMAVRDSDYVSDVLACIHSVDSECSVAVEEYDSFCDQTVERGLLDVLAQRRERVTRS